MQPPPKWERKRKKERERRKKEGERSLDGRVTPNELAGLSHAMSDGVIPAT
jgi:hypothetical protein